MEELLRLYSARQRVQENTSIYKAVVSSIKTVIVGGEWIKRRVAKCLKKETTINEIKASFT